MNTKPLYPVPPDVLVVDDDPTIRLLARETLEQAGFTVVEAENGEEALASFAARPPDLMLLDVMMPGIDGYDVCRQIRSQKDGQNTAILMMTGLDDLGSVQRAYDAGATDFITKPINWLLLGHRASYLFRANKAFQDLRNSEAQLRTAQSIAKLGSWTWDVMNNTIEGSMEVSSILGLAPTRFDSTYANFLSFIHPIDKEQVKLTFEGAIAAKQSFHIDHKVILANGRECFVSTEGQPVIDRQGRLILMTGTIQDITERKQAEAQIHALALYDSLTGLPNRILFRDRLEQALQQAIRFNTVLAVMFIDLDYFKDVNDSLGHNAGDALLSEVAQRLQAATRAIDTVARLGGDEFTIFLQNITSLDSVCTVAQKIMLSISQPFVIESRTIFVTASIGIAVYPDDGDTIDDLLKQADTAMYHAKEQGKNNYQLFSPTMQAQANTRLTLQNEMRIALQNQQFTLHYQPKYNLLSGEMTGMEALVRWQHPERGLISPNTFIPVAEATGLIIPLGEWVLLEACRQNMKWQEMGYRPIMIAVNVSDVQLNQPGFVAALQRALETTGMDPCLLQIELTESALMKNRQTSKERRNLYWEDVASSLLDGERPNAPPLFTTLDEIQKLGVSIALDDFGVGYSSLSYIRYLPLNVLKINPSFIWDISAWHGNEIISAIIKMSKSLNLSVIAEGVETEYQRSYLLQHGCQEIQGYLTGKPANAADVEKYFLPQVTTPRNKE